MLHNVYLCIDNIVELQRYNDLIVQIAQDSRLLVKITSFSTGEQLLSHNNKIDGDIIYLSGNVSLEIADKLRKSGSKSEIIFLMSDEENSLDAFLSTPFYSILKEQTTDERFKKIFLKACAVNAEKPSPIFSFRNNEALHNVPLNSISHFEMKGRIAAVHYDNKFAEFYSSMENLENVLRDKSFIRVQRSFLVNVKFIEFVAKNHLVLVTNVIIPLGSTTKFHLLYNFQQ